MINILSKFDTIQQKIWPYEGDALPRKTKAEVYDNLTIRFLKNIL